LLRLPLLAAFIFFVSFLFPIVSPILVTHCCARAGGARHLAG
jgi:hypothetical protein